VNYTGKKEKEGVPCFLIAMRREENKQKPRQVSDHLIEENPRFTWLLY